MTPLTKLKEGSGSHFLCGKCAREKRPQVGGPSRVIQIWPMRQSKHLQGPTVVRERCAVELLLHDPPAGWTWPTPAGLAEATVESAYSNAPTVITNGAGITRYMYDKRTSDDIWNSSVAYRPPVS